MEDFNAIEILIVEDNPHDAELTIRALRKNNLANHVLIAEEPGQKPWIFYFAGVNLRPEISQIRLRLFSWTLNFQK